MNYNTEARSGALQNTAKLNQETNDKWAQFDTLSDHLRGRVVEPHEDFDVVDAEPIQPAMLEMQEVVDGLPEEELQTYKDQMLAEISDREAIVDAINRRLDTVQAKQYTHGVRSAITKQVKL